MYFGKLTLNIMTLGGLTLGVGMLVDNSIVVLENIYRHIESSGEPQESAARGAQEVASAITASTLTTVVVFLPVAFVGGVSGIIFKELAWTVTLSLLASLVVSLTVVPMLASKWLARKKTRPLGLSGSHSSSGGYTRSGTYGGHYSSSNINMPLRSGETRDLMPRERTSRKSQRPSRYRRLVEWSLDNRFLVFLIVAGLIASTVYLGKDLGTEFLPAADEGGFSINISMTENSPMDNIDSLVSQIEDILDKNSSINMYSVSIGRGDSLSSLRLSKGSSAEITAIVSRDAFKKKETRQVMEDVEGQVNEIKSDARITFNLQSTISMMAGGLAGSVEVSVSGPDILEVTRLNNILTEKIRHVEGVKDVTSTLTERKHELHVVVDRDKATLYGLTPAQVGNAVSRAVRGQTVSRLEKDGTTLDIVIGYEEDAVKTTEDIGSLLLTGRTGSIPLKDIAKIIDGQGPRAVNRTDQRLSAGISAEYSNTSLGVVTRNINDIIAELSVPEGYRISVGGMSQIMSEGFETLKLALVLAAILVYMVMAASFESLAMPLVIMFTMPLGAIGVVAALHFSGYAFGITAFIGVIVLAGVIVNNGIVMVDFINQQRSTGIPLGEAICGGSDKRLRPVMMTSLTTILGLVPMALGFGEGGELSAPMALSIMGGLVVGTLLTLIVVPVVYSLFAGYKPDRPERKFKVDREQELKEYQRLQKVFHGTGNDPVVGHDLESETELKIQSYGKAHKLEHNSRGITPENGQTSKATGETYFGDEDMAQLIDLLARLMESAKKTNSGQAD